MSAEKIKYTKDGKKVTVLGKLNSEESIVQEIFVSEGQEIPGGENFVAKGLLDAPAESWKDKDLRKKEERYPRRIKELEAALEKETARLTEAMSKAKLQASALFSFAQGSHEEDLKTLQAFVSGDITHFFCSGEQKIVTWDADSVFRIDNFYGRKKIEGMKLVSLYGNSKGDLNYRISAYGDGSGGSRDIVPFTCYEHALAHAQSVFDDASAGYLSGDRRWFHLDKWSEIEGIVIGAEVQAKIDAEKEAARTEKITKLKEELAALEEGA